MIWPATFPPTSPQQILCEKPVPTYRHIYRFCSKPAGGDVWGLERGTGPESLKAVMSWGIGTGFHVIA